MFLAFSCCSMDNGEIHSRYARLPSATSASASAWKLLICIGELSAIGQRLCCFILHERLHVLFGNRSVLAIRTKYLPVVRAPSGQSHGENQDGIHRKVDPGCPYFPLYAHVHELPHNFHPLSQVIGTVVTINRHIRRLKELVQFIHVSVAKSPFSRELKLHACRFPGRIALVYPLHHSVFHFTR